MNNQKAKGFSLDRFLTDPLAMFGALGAMGALVVGVWIVAGPSTAKDEDGPDGGFSAAPTKSAVSARAAEVGSSLKVAKLKTPGAARGEASEVLKDAHGSASAGSDGFLRGTISEIEAAEKAKTAEAEKAPEAAAPQSGGNKKPIPIEAAGGAHVPGSAPDSTKLAALPKGTFGPAANLGNADFAGGVGTGGGAPASTGFEAGNPGSPDLGEGGPLVAANLTLPGKAAVAGSRQFLRGQAGAAGPAAAGAAQRATGGVGAGGGAVGSAASGAGPDFYAGGTSFSPGGAGGGAFGG